jgi:hypothetical protein
MKKLPVIPLVRHTLNSVFAFRAAGMRIGLPWIVLLAALNALQLVLNAGSPDNQTSPMSLNPLDFLSWVVGLIAVSSLAVNWHRFILQDVTPPPDKIFRLDGLVWKYFLRSALVILLTILPALFITSAIATFFPAASPLAVVPLFIAAVYVVRLSVALPATALERHDFGIADALRVTAGNDLQFAGLVLLNTLIFAATLLALAVILSIVGAISQNAATALAISLSVPVNLFLSLFSISLLSSLYGYFVENRDF